MSGDNENYLELLEEAAALNLLRYATPGQGDLLRASPGLGTPRQAITGCRELRCVAKLQRATLGEDRLPWGGSGYRGPRQAEVSELP